MISESRIVTATGFATPVRKVGSVKATMRFIKRHSFFIKIRYSAVSTKIVYAVKRIIGHTGVADGTPPPQ
jgi:hypothetical protein